jgi:NNP family nitrate/nitrite transporter-like MFS transporter
VIARRQQTWVMSFLYIGTFGSFVGYSAAFPLLLKTQFPAVTASLAFLGSRGRYRSPVLSGLHHDYRRVA